MNNNSQWKISAKVQNIVKSICESTCNSPMLKICHEDIFISLVKWTFDKSDYKIQKNIREEFGDEDCIGYTQVVRKKNGNGWNKDIISFASKQCNIEPIHAAIVVGELLHITPEQCFTAFGKKDADKPECMSIYNKVTDSIPRTLHSKRCNYYLEYIDYQQDYSGYTWQAICIYTDEEKNFYYLFACRAIIKNMLTMKIGIAKAEARILSENIIRSESKSHVLFCVALPVALHLRHNMSDGNILEGKYIVSGYLDRHGTPELFALRDRAVTIVPEFTYDGFTAAKALAQQIENLGATQVTICPLPIITDGIPPSTYTAGTSSPWKDSLLEQAIRLSEVIDMPATVQKIADSALPLTKWEHLLTKLGLQKPEPEATQTMQTGMVFKNLADTILSVTPMDNDEKPLMENLVKKGFILFVWGNSNCGKSRVILTLILALATGDSAFCFAGTGRQRKVLLLDGELTEVELLDRINQVASSHIPQNFMENITYYLARGNNSVNLLAPEVQSRILKQIENDKIEVLVIDPLTCFCPDLSEASVAKLFEFFYKVEEHGAAVVFTHHAKKDGKDFKGASDLKNKSQTVIHIEGCTDLLSAKDNSETIKSALSKSKGGTVVRLNFIECKAPSALNGQHVVYHLPKRGSWNLVEGIVDEAALVTDTPILSTCDSTEQEMLEHIHDGNLGNESESATLRSLNSQQQMVYKFFLDKRGKKITRKDIQGAFRMGEDGAGNVLKVLKNKKLITAIGSAKNIGYIKE